jgi:hypothetical protein
MAERSKLRPIVLACLGELTEDQLWEVDTDHLVGAELQIMGEPTTSERTGRTHLKVREVRRLPSGQPVATGAAEDVPY